MHQFVLTIAFGRRLARFECSCNRTGICAWNRENICRDTIAVFVPSHRHFFSYFTSIGGDGKCLQGCTFASFNRLVCARNYTNVEFTRHGGKCERLIFEWVLFVVLYTGLIMHFSYWWYGLLFVNYLNAWMWRGSVLKHIGISKIFT